MAVEQSARLKLDGAFHWPGADAIAQIRDRAQAWQMFQNRQVLLVKRSLSSVVTMDVGDNGGPLSKKIALETATTESNQQPSSNPVTTYPQVMEQLRPKTSSTLMGMALKKK
jgi:hypothetical protein